MVDDKLGNVMVTAGNNGKKTEYIKTAVDAGINVLADKPMCINAGGFALLKEAFASAEENDVLLYDIMTERSEINTILQKELSLMPSIFGKLEIISAKIDPFFPVGGAVGPRIMPLNLHQIILYVRAFRGIYVNYRVHLAVHGFLNQGGMEMARIQCDEFHFIVRADKPAPPGAT
ncbi:hypothetical protein ES703_82814 [subsurface metagenome]